MSVKERRVERTAGWIGDCGIADRRVDRAPDSTTSPSRAASVRTPSKVACSSLTQTLTVLAVAVTVAKPRNTSLSLKTTLVRGLGF
jgi:hypothetical protein